MKLETLEKRSKERIHELAELWQRSVEATHHFLSEEDVKKLRPMVEEALFAIDVLVIAVDDEGGKAMAFMGVEEEKIEMLFADPPVRGKGVGSEMVRHAVSDLGAVYVDVNEQNDQGVGFYRRVGFEQIARSKLDGQGNPFPILHLKIGGK